MLLNGGSSHEASTSSGELTSSWWLSKSPEILGLDRKSLIKSIVLPELRKNLALQRLTNEISLEVA
jgi:hypothetical protein